MILLNVCLLINILEEINENDYVISELKPDIHENVLTKSKSQHYK